MNPLASMITHERLREHDLLMRQSALRERENMERIAHMERDRAVELERAKLLRAASTDPFSLHHQPSPLSSRPGDPFLPPPASLYTSGNPLLAPHGHPSLPPKPPGAGTPMIPGLGLAGLPPPLIPSAAVRSHNNSPITNPKAKSGTPTSAGHHPGGGGDKPHPSSNGLDHHGPTEHQSR